uniref:Polymorphic transmembrane cluster 2 transmembrane protein 1 n=1 Tax=Biomphalaria glabrata TaxID=6526 RepID=A0A7G8ZAV9_BIOGL|nr:polymorphic transmembrane cluster 2 transmembrane protein 1 [Biomphalaria glabrata]
MEERNLLNLMLTLLYATVYFVSYIPRQACERCGQEECILLFDNYSEENEPKCHIGYVDGLDQFVIKGQVNTTQRGLSAVGFEFVSENSKTPNYYCLIRFVMGCQSQQTDACYCMGTDKGKASLVFNLTLRHQDSDTKVRAVMLLPERRKIFSNAIRLPNVTKIDFTKVSSVLKINDRIVDNNFCLRSVTDPTIKIAYHVPLTQTVRPQLLITNNNETSLWTDNVEGSFNLINLSVESPSEVDFTFSLCGFNEKYVHCTFIKGENYDFKSFKDAFQITLSVSVVLIALYTCMILFWCWKHAKHLQTIVIRKEPEEMAPGNYQELSQNVEAARRKDILSEPENRHSSSVL